MVTSSFVLSDIEVPVDFQIKTPHNIFPNITEILKKTSDVEEIEKVFSPLEKKFSVFISHSFHDKEKAQYLKYFIEKTKPFENESVFIDSLYWDNKSRLIINIFQYYEEKYQYLDIHKRLKIIDNINMMLLRSLCRMIKKCDLFVFIKTDTSTQQNHNGSISTHSPWIYYELFTASLFKEHLGISMETLSGNPELLFSYTLNGQDDNVLPHKIIPFSILQRHILNAEFYVDSSFSGSELTFGDICEGIYERYVKK